MSKRERIELINRIKSLSSLPKEEAKQEARKLMDIGNAGGLSRYEGGLDFTYYDFGEKRDERGPVTWAKLDPHTNKLFEALAGDEDFLTNHVVSLGSGPRPLFENVLSSLCGCLQMTCLDIAFEGEDDTKDCYNSNQVAYDWSKQELDEKLSELKINHKEATLVLVWPPADFHDGGPWSTIPESLFQTIQEFARIAIVVDRYESCGTKELWDAVEKDGKEPVVLISGMCTSYQCVEYRK